MWQLLLPGVMTYFSPLYVRHRRVGPCPHCRGRTPVEPVPNSPAHVFSPALLLSFSLSWADLPFWFPSEISSRSILCSIVLRLVGRSSGARSGVAYLVAFSLSVLSGYGLALLPALTARWRQRICWGIRGFGCRRHSIGVNFLAASRSSRSIEHPILFPRRQVPSSCSGVCQSVQRSAALLGTRLILLLFVIVIDLHTTNFTTNLTEGQNIRSALTQPEIAATFQAAQTLADETTSFSASGLQRTFDYPKTAECSPAGRTFGLPAFLRSVRLQHLLRELPG